MYRTELRYGITPSDEVMLHSNLVSLNGSVITSENTAAIFSGLKPDSGICRPWHTLRVSLYSRQTVLAWEMRSLRWFSALLIFNWPAASLVTNSIIFCWPFQPRIIVKKRLLQVQDEGSLKGSSVNNIVLEEGSLIFALKANFLLGAKKLGPVSRPGRQSALTGPASGSELAATPPAGYQGFPETRPPVSSRLLDGPEPKPPISVKAHVLPTLWNYFKVLVLSR